LRDFEHYAQFSKQSLNRFDFFIRFVTNCAITTVAQLRHQDVFIGLLEPTFAHCGENMAKKKKTLYLTDYLLPKDDAKMYG
jgi:hypothetical protein